MTTTPVGVTTEENLMKVSGSSPPQSVAHSISRSILDCAQYPAVRAIGAGAVAQACKAIAIARGMVATRGIDLAVNVGFETVHGEAGQELSAMVFFLFPR